MVKNSFQKNSSILLFSKNAFYNCYKLSIENKSTRCVNHFVFKKWYLEKVAHLK